MKTTSGLVASRPKKRMPKFTDKALSPLSRLILSRIKSVGQAYSSGIGKHLNPWFETNLPSITKACCGAGRFLGMYSICLVLYVLLHTGEPAMALFLSEAQDYVTGLPFFEGVTSLVDVFFGVLRAAIVIIIGYFVVRIGLAVRQDEDWQTFVRYPLFIVASIAVADFLTAFLVT
ncbi:MAG: hypothetical protein AAF974_00070 [Cyanobacteria bacterium P01_E01_bin.34]